MKLDETSARDLINQISGSTPDEMTIKDNGFDFEIKTNRTGYSVFTHDGNYDPDYVIVNTEIDGDGKGRYQETLLYRQRPIDGKTGWIIEGIYDSPIEYYDKPEAEFHGYCRVFASLEDWEAATEDMEQRFRLRTCNNLMDFMQNEIRVVSQMINCLGNSEKSRKTHDRFQAMMAETVRTFMTGKDSRNV